MPSWLLPRAHLINSSVARHPPSDLGHFQMMDFHRAADAIEVGRKAIEKVAYEVEDLKTMLG